MRQQICLFELIPDEKKKPGRKYTCVHGKTLTWETARRALGLNDARKENAPEEQKDWRKPLPDFFD